MHLFNKKKYSNSNIEKFHNSRLEPSEIILLCCLLLKATLWNFSTFIIYYQNPLRWYIDFQ